MHTEDVSGVAMPFAITFPVMMEKGCSRDEMLARQKEAGAKVESLRDSLISYTLWDLWPLEGDVHPVANARWLADERFVSYASLDYAMRYHGVVHPTDTDAVRLLTAWLADFAHKIAVSVGAVKVLVEFDRSAFFMHVD